MKPAFGKLCLVLASSFAILVLNSCNQPTGELDGESEFPAAENILGRGYDVFSFYADPEYVLAEILDFDKLEVDGMIEKAALGRTEFGESSGTSTSSYQSNLGITASLSGTYKFFSGSVKASFSSLKALSSKYQFCTIHASVKKSKYAVKNASDTSALKNYLTDSFKTALADSVNYPPETLFRTYGTHVLACIVMGGRFDYNLSAMESNNSESNTISVFAKAKFKAAFASAAASAGFTSDSKSDTGFSSEETSTKVVGNGSLTVSAGDSGFSSWLSGLCDENAVFSDFSGGGGLVPIWELCDDATRGEAIEAYFDEREDLRYTAYMSSGDEGGEEAKDDAVVKLAIELSDRGDTHLLIRPGEWWPGFRVHDADPMSSWAAAPPGPSMARSS